MIKAGDKVPNIELRTDEGTPIALTDLRGRAFALFMVGEMFTPTVERLLAVLAKDTPRFLTMDCSPIAAIGEPMGRLAAYREQHRVPFVMISDSGLRLHKKLSGENRDVSGAWIVDPTGTVVDVVPVLPPSELVRLALIGVDRTLSGRRPANPSGGRETELKKGKKGR